MSQYTSPIFSNAENVVANTKGQKKVVKIELLEQKETQDATAELVQDMMAIIAVFAARLYGARSKKFRQKVKQAMKEVIDYGPGQKDDEGRD